MTFSPTVGGWHDLNWRYTVVEDSEAFLETDRAFATFTDVGTIVRDLLQRTAEQLPDDQVVREFGYVVDYYQALLTCWTYSQTDAAVRPAVDRGLAYLVADSLRGRLPQTRPAGALIAFSQGTTRFQFSDPGKVTTASVDADAWCELAKPFLASDACFAAYLSQGFGYSHYPERQPEIRSYPTEELAF
jgi:hypothetical protein